MKDFNNKVVVITGGATGIGFALAKRIGKEGAKIVIAGLRENRLKEAVSELKEQNVEATYQICDVTKESDLIQLEQFVTDKYDRVEVLINNAGIGGVRKTVFEISPEEVQATLDVNLYAVWNAIRIFGNKMIAAGRPCAIYNIGSENSFFNAVKKGSAYILSKYAIHALTKSLKEEAPEFMDVGIIIPGFVATEIGPKEFMQYGMPADEFVDRLMPQIKAGAFYIVSHPYNAVRIGEAYQKVKKAFDTYAPRFEGDEQYDIEIFIDRLRNSKKS